MKYWNRKHITHVTLTRSGIWNIWS